MMNRPALLVLVRHGESAMNVAKKGNIYLPEETAVAMKGIPDHKIPLTENGIRQAIITGQGLKRDYGLFHTVYDSSYLRAAQTRENILSAYTAEEVATMKIRQSHLIRERERGYTFDMTTEEAERHFPWLKAYYESFGHFYARPPGGQSQADLCAQVYEFLGILFRLRAGQNVLTINHGHTLRAFRFNLEKWSVDDYEKSVEDGLSFNNCSVTTYRYNFNTQKLELERLNETYW